MQVKSLDDVTDTRLCWPEGKPRTSERQDRSYRSSFFGTSQKPMTRARGHAEIEYEMQRWEIRNYVISLTPAYRQGPSDPGVALWWTDPKTKELRVLACDLYAKPHDNLHAIALTLEAMRGLERWGAYTMEQAAEGAKLQLPAPEGASEIRWQAVFGDVPAGLDKVDALAVINGRYRRQAADANGDEGELKRLNLAIDAARREFA